ncbi:MAG TPA: DMT family protein [Sedimentisphaerales bacterium]|nr:DMT family protein [Sedimentisphaerales bacterium]
MGKWATILLLICSNMFMTYAWYGHLKDFRNNSLLVVIILSWSVAFLEYCLQVPANRIGFHYFSLSQLKVLQEIVTISVFAVFSTVYMKETPKLDFLWAAFCLAGAAYFMFRGFAVR